MCRENVSASGPALSSNAWYRAILACGRRKPYRRAVRVRREHFRGVPDLPQTVKTMLDEGSHNCIDRKTANLKWQYPSHGTMRFFAQAEIVGDRVVFGGLETLAC